MTTTAQTRTIQHCWRLGSLTDVATLAASTLLLGCNRSSPRAEQTAKAAAPAESTSAPVASLPQQIADAMVRVNGGIHDGARFNHAKGIVVSGSSSRPHGFVVGTGEDFLAFFKAIAASGPDAAHPTPIETFMASHPRAAKFAVEVRALPRSYATLAYFSNNAVVFVDGNGKKQPVRYQIIPVAGVATLDSASATKAGGNYLREEIQHRLARGPAEFLVWPDDRKRVLLGTIRLTKVEPKQEELQRSLAFNPTFLTSGIELSDDPLVPLRSAVYALSVAHRR